MVIIWIFDVEKVFVIMISLGFFFFRWSLENKMAKLENKIH